MNNKAQSKRQASKKPSAKGFATGSKKAASEPSPLSSIEHVIKKGERRPMNKVENNSNKNESRPQEETKEDYSTMYNIKNGCVFCNLIHCKKDLLIYEDKFCAAFHDKKKKSAREHILMCPKDHIRDAHTVTEQDTFILEHLQKSGETLLQKFYPGKQYK